MYKKLMLGMALMALVGCGVEVYDYPGTYGSDDSYTYDWHSDSTSWNEDNYSWDSFYPWSYPSSTPGPNITPAPTPIPAPVATPTPVPTGNRNPVINSLTANPQNTVEPGQTITFNADVVDDDHDTLKYTWSATGGVLSTTAGRLVSWTPPARTGIYTVLVSISDGRGGTAEGALNLIVKSNGSTTVSGQVAIAN